MQEDSNVVVHQEKGLRVVLRRFFLFALFDLCVAKFSFFIPICDFVMSEGVSSPTMVRRTLTSFGSDSAKITGDLISIVNDGEDGVETKVTAPMLMLNSGHQIPILGLGTWKSKPGEVTDAVKYAIDAGYRHIDCAYNYLNEGEVGTGIKAKLDEGVVKREDLFICSKLWNTFHRPDLVEKAVRHSLNDLQLEYLDLYLIHFPTAFHEGGDRYPRDDAGNVVFSNVDFCDTWKAMEELVGKGLVKSIGVSNFNSQQLERILNCATIPPAINQIEIHPYMTQEKLVNFCMSKNVAVTAYSPLRSQDRSIQGEPTLLDEPVIHEIAGKYDKSVAQVILRWIFQRGIIVIPKSVSKDRIIQNINIFDFNLAGDDMARIDSLNRNRRANTLDAAKNHREYPFNIEF